jgi:hypothetical protein
MGRPSDRSPVYGIVAVGKYMRVYKYDDVNESVLNWSFMSCINDYRECGLK